MTIKVNLGSGDFPAAGWVNVDHESPHPHDVTADLTKPLPDELADVEYAYAGHVLEHLHPDDVISMLAGLRTRMAFGGQVMVVGPDVVRARVMHERGELDGEWLRLVVEGGDRWPGDRHLWPCAPVLVETFLRQAGWRDAREVPLLSVSQMDWPIVSYEPWQCAVTAYA